MLEQVHKVELSDTEVRQLLGAVDLALKAGGIDAAFVVMPVANRLRELLEPEPPKKP